MNDILYNIVYVLIVSIITVIARYAIPLLIQTLRERNYNFAAEIIEKIVRMIEQTMIGSGLGDKKLESATEFAKEVLEHYKIKLTDDQIRQLIEASVQVINTEIGKNKYDLDGMA